MSTEVSTVLTPEEYAELKEREARIRGKLFDFLEVGKDLLAIRDKKLWRAHSSFDAYLAYEFPTISQFTNRYLRGLAAAAEVVSDIQEFIASNENVETGTIVPVLPMAIPLPENQYQARSLAPIPREARGPVWKDLVERNGGTPPTGKTIQNAVTQFFDGEAPPEVEEYHGEPRDPEEGVEILPPENPPPVNNRFSTSYRERNRTAPSYKFTVCLESLKCINAWSRQALESGNKDTWKLALEQIGEEAELRMQEVTE